MLYTESFPFFLLGRENLQQQPIRASTLPFQGTDHHILPFTYPCPKLRLSPKHPCRQTLAFPFPTKTPQQPPDSLWFSLSSVSTIILFVPQPSLVSCHPQPRPEAETRGAVGEVLQRPVGTCTAQALPGHLQSQ